MPSFHVTKAHPFFDAAYSIVRTEIKPGRTVTFIGEVDLTEIEAIRSRSGAQRPSYTAMVIKALALAMREFPYANRRVYRRWWLPFSAVRMQSFMTCDVAVACERNLTGAEAASFADILRDADRLGIAEITAWLRTLSGCDASNNRQWSTFLSIIERFPRPLAAILIRLPVYFPWLWAKYRGGAAWVSSPAKYGVDGVVGTWPSPLGVSFGLVKQRPVVRDGKVVACPTFLLTLNWDRRVMAGAQAARFFRRIVEILEQAQTEMAPYLPISAQQNPSDAKRVVQVAEAAILT